ncbi:hypothetical protein KC319_g19885, partial [Hortaea werneckii]
VLLVSYLANTIRTQIDLSNRLATAALTMGGGDGEGKTGGEGGEKKRGGGDRQQRNNAQQAGPGGRRGEQ